MTWSLLLLVPPVSLGHDLWLKPRGPAALGTPITVEALSGMMIPESDHGPDPSTFPRRFVIDPAGQEQPLETAGREPKAGLLHFTPRLPGIHVVAEANLGWDYPGPESTHRGTARTDAQGEAMIPLVRPGWMAIRLPHMTRPGAADHEWESFWTTLTFPVGP
ncbi:MAG TPA: hypothetical protein PKC45_02260 [Gemmatales bacterium]|nr:hypothetical protein [Gemmatales bacterium]